MVARKQVVVTLAFTTPLALARVPVESVNHAVLVALNATVDGRLHAAKPVSAPCYSTFDGRHVGRDSTSCAIVEANYTNPLYRVTQPGAYMVCASIIFPCVSR
jgi:hypothetical protein